MEDVHQRSPAGNTPAMELVETAELSISHIPGRSGVHVASFTGVGSGVGGIQAREFRRSMGSESKNAVTYVIDRTRSWYNRTSAAVVETLNAIEGTDRLVTLGNSMGGFGAIYHASLLRGCTRAIGLSPQYSVNPAFMPANETRWPEHREGIVHAIGHAFETLRPEIEYHLFFGQDSRPDLRHARLFGAHRAPNVHIYVVGGGAHSLSATLKEAGVLPDLVTFLIGSESCRPAEVMAMLTSAGIEIAHGRDLRGRRI